MSSCRINELTYVGKVVSEHVENDLDSRAKQVLVLSFVPLGEDCGEEWRVRRIAQLATKSPHATAARTIESGGCVPAQSTHNLFVIVAHHQVSYRIHGRCSIRTLFAFEPRDGEGESPDFFAF